MRRRRLRSSYCVIRRYLGPRPSRTMGGGDDEADYVARAQTELRGALAAMSDLEAVLGDKFAEDLVEEPVANADSEVCQLRAELEKIR